MKLSVLNIFAINHKYEQDKHEERVEKQHHDMGGGGGEGGRSSVL